LTGDSHAHLLKPMRAFAESLGFTVCVRRERRSRFVTTSVKRSVREAKPMHSSGARYE